jgi:hypothetical protein
MGQMGLVVAWLVQMANDAFLRQIGAARRDVGGHSRGCGPETCSLRSGQRWESCFAGIAALLRGAGYLANLAGGLVAVLAQFQGLILIRCLRQDWGAYTGQVCWLGGIANTSYDATNTTFDTFFRLRGLAESGPRSLG